MSVIHPEVLAILVCPVPDCRVRRELKDGALVCTRCGRRYRMEENWPVLIPEEAQLPVSPGG